MWGIARNHAVMGATTEVANSVCRGRADRRPQSLRAIQTVR